MSEKKISVKDMLKAKEYIKHSNIEFFKLDDTIRITKRDLIILLNDFYKTLDKLG